jgi:hypothetical protein
MLRNMPIEIYTNKREQLDADVELVVTPWRLRQWNGEVRSLAYLEFLAQHIVPTSDDLNRLVESFQTFINHDMEAFIELIVRDIGGHVKAIRLLDLHADELDDDVATKWLNIYDGTTLGGSEHSNLGLRYLSKKLKLDVRDKFRPALLAEMKLPERGIPRVTQINSVARFSEDELKRARSLKQTDAASQLDYTPRNIRKLVKDSKLTPGKGGRVIIDDKFLKLNRARHNPVRG